MEHGYEQEPVTSHPASPMTKCAVLGYVSASAKLSVTLFLSAASPWGGRAASGLQHGDAGHTVGRTGPAWHCLTLAKAIGLGLLTNHRWKGEAVREEGKELIWKRSCICTLCLTGWGWTERMTMFIQHVYTETLSFWETFNMWCHPKVPGTWRPARLGWSSAAPMPGGHQCSCRWYWPIAWHKDTADRDDLFLFRLTLFCYCCAMFPSQPAQVRKVKGNCLNPRKELSLWQN